MRIHGCQRLTCILHRRRIPLPTHPHCNKHLIRILFTVMHILPTRQPSNTFICLVAGLNTLFFGSRMHIREPKRRTRCHHHLYTNSIAINQQKGKCVAPKRYLAGTERQSAPRPSRHRCNLAQLPFGVRCRGVFPLTESTTPPFLSKRLGEVAEKR